MAELSKRRRASLARWALFSVSLPLLPVFATLIVHWFTNDASEITFTTVFGDGELLVLATVVAAAGIGDVFFGDDTEGPHPSRNSALAFSLLVVVASVFLFGLVTVTNRASRDDIARIKAETEVRAATIESNADQIESLSQQQNDLNGLLAYAQTNQIPQSAFAQSLSTQNQALLNELKATNSHLTRVQANDKKGNYVTEAENRTFQAALSSVFSLLREPLGRRPLCDRGDFAVDRVGRERLARGRARRQRVAIHSGLGTTESTSVDGQVGVAICSETARLTACGRDRFAWPAHERSDPRTDVRVRNRLAERAQARSTIAKTLAGNPEPSWGFGQVATMRAPVGGTWSRPASTSICHLSAPSM